MQDREIEARELLAREYERAHEPGAAKVVREQHINMLEWDDAAAIRAILQALPIRSEAAQDQGASFGSGSREPSPAVSAASGFDPSREAIEAAIKETEYKYFGDYEMSESQIDAVYLLVDCGRSLNRVRDVLQRRSIPTMDPVWSAAFNSALDLVASAIEARRAATLGAVEDESAAPQGETPANSLNTQVSP